MIMMDNPHFTKKHAHRNLFFELSSDHALQIDAKCNDLLNITS
jgi:hypothetical protein